MSKAEKGTGGSVAGVAPRLYTIAPGLPFLDTLAQAILDGNLPVTGGSPPDRLDLSRWTILLPTRRAARALGEAFMRASGEPAMLLPRIRPLGDVDEDELALGGPDYAGAGGDALGLPAAIGTIERRMVLARLIMKWSESNQAGDELLPVRATAAQAAGLAAQLASLMDQFDMEQADLEGLKGLVGEPFADHWQKTLEFLKIVTGFWPEYLAEKDAMSPYKRRDELMRLETERLVSTPPDHPVIAAGSTATAPATAALLEAVARLENGAVVLPGLDLALDEESWEAIGGSQLHPEHPQFGMNRFLRELGMSRDEVIPLGGDGPAGVRAMFISEVMRPAGKTEKWQELGGDSSGRGLLASLDGVTHIAAPTPQDEAEAISLLLRRAAQEAGKTAALVTPDRVLARRVSVRLRKWGLVVDDSAGVPLEKTLPGSFMNALADCFAKGLDPVSLLALLKHPLARLGRGVGEMRHAARLLELTAFRQPMTGRGLSSHRDAAMKARERIEGDGHAHPLLRRLGDRGWDTVESLLDDLERAFRPLQDLFDEGSRTHVPETLFRAHIETAQALASDEAGSSAALYRGDAGDVLANMLESLLTADTAGLELSAAEYPEFYRAMTAGQPVRPRAPRHPRIHIWGPLEARLQRPDMVILGSLNEGTWPATPETDPWLSRPMRHDLGLPSPERRIGLSAHDVVQLMGVEEVYLTRAEKEDGAPTVPSRWLLRLDAVLEALGKPKALEPAEPWLGWARARDAAADVEPVAAPAPTPRVSARPKKLSVTRIETWIANPYAIFAEDILKLKKLDELAGEPDAALKGSLIHAIMQRFTEAHPDKLPADIAAELLRFARMEFDQFAERARIETFWWGQFANFARWFAATEKGRRVGIKQVHAEARGEMVLAGDFTLSGRADRLDEREDGSIAIYDYKTGTIPSAGEVDGAKAPQLPLEAVMVSEGAFPGVPSLPVTRLAYIRARGYGQGGEERDAGRKLSPSELASEAREKLEGLISAYSRESQSYTALRRSEFANSAQYRYDNYAHLARVREWQAAGEGED